MIDRFGVTTDYDYSAEHKRKKLHVWSGPWFHTWEAVGLSLPSGKGYMLTTYNGDKIRVECPAPRDDKNWEEVDKAIAEAMTEHYKAKGVNRAVPE
jgi:hypothetical protein